MVRHRSLENLPGSCESPERAVNNQIVFNQEVMQ